MDWARRRALGMAVGYVGDRAVSRAVSGALGRLRRRRRRPAAAQNNGTFARAGPGRRTGVPGWARVQRAIRWLSEGRAEPTRNQVADRLVDGAAQRRRQNAAVVERHRATVQNRNKPWNDPSLTLSEQRKLLKDAPSMPWNERGMPAQNRARWIDAFMNEYKPKTEGTNARDREILAARNKAARDAEAAARNAAHQAQRRSEEQRRLREVQRRVLEREQRLRAIAKRTSRK